MSGDCGHGWGYHLNGPSSPCSKCEEENKKPKIKDLQSTIESQAAEIERLKIEIDKCKSLIDFGIQLLGVVNKFFKINQWGDSPTAKMVNEGIETFNMFKEKLK